MTAERVFGYDPLSREDAAQPPIPPRYAGVVESWKPPPPALINITTPNVCRSGRGLLGWSVAELEKRSGVDRTLIARFEAGAGDLTDAERTAIHQAMVAAGAEYLPDPRRGAGLHLNRELFSETQNAARAAANAALRQAAAS